MKELYQKAVALVIIFALCSGCASTSGNAPSTNSDSTGNDATKTKAQGLGIGALIGAGIGAVIGAAVGGRDGALIGAAAGAALGGLGGFALGSAVAARKKKYANEEDRLNDLLKIAAKDNKELTDYNSQTLAQIKTLDCEISELKKCYAQDVSKIGDMEEKQKEINSLIIAAEKQKTNMTNEFGALNEYLQSIKQTQQQAKVDQLEQEVSALKTNIEMLDNNNKQMAQMAETLTVRK